MFHAHAVYLNPKPFGKQKCSWQCCKVGLDGHLYPDLGMQGFKVYGLYFVSIVVC